MPRRAPPTSLRLVQGPIPVRTASKYTMPTVPCPAFHSLSNLSDGSIYCPPQIIYLQNMNSGGHSPPIHGLSKIQRGPWDHSGSITLPFDVESMLAPLKPVAGYRGVV